MKPPWKRPPDAPELNRGGKIERGVRTGLSGYLSYFGPATLAAVAYIDPGNFGTDITAGAGYGYLLLWAVLLASLMGMLPRYLTGKRGIATSQSLAALIRQSLGRRSRVIPYWLASEVFAVFTDLAEFLGVTSAIYLLSGGAISLLVAAWISAFDVIVVFAFAGKKFRRIELMITMLVFGIGLGYVYEIFLVGPNAVAVGSGLIIPTLVGSNQLFLVVGIIGATVMPHALVLHSSLTKARAVGLDLEQRKKLLRYHKWDAIGNLNVAGMIKMAISIQSAAPFFAAGLTVATVNEAYKTLAPLFGLAASVVFALTLLFSELSSSTVGVLAGPSNLEGFLGTKLNPLFRRIILRGVNVITHRLAISLDYYPLLLLRYSQVVLSLMIPLPLIPLIYSTSRTKVMGQFVNRRAVTALSVLTASVIVGLNGVLLYTTLLP